MSPSSSIHAVARIKASYFLAKYLLSIYIYYNFFKISNILIMICNFTNFTVKIWFMYRTLQQYHPSHQCSFPFSIVSMSPLTSSPLSPPAYDHHGELHSVFRCLDSFCYSFIMVLSIPHMKEIILYPFSLLANYSQCDTLNFHPPSGKFHFSCRWVVFLHAYTPYFV